MIKKNLIQICENLESREILIDTLCQGITNTSDFRDAINYIIDNKISMFNIEEFKSQLYEDEEEYLDLLLPTFRRVWGRVYIQPPPLFRSKEKLDLFRLNFDINEFLDYLKETFIKTKGCLENFEYIDRTPKHLEIIVDNYISLLVKRVLDCKDYIEETRELKLKKLIK